jgi:hypothetical protein
MLTKQVKFIPTIAIYEDTNLSYSTPFAPVKDTTPIKQQRKQEPKNNMKSSSEIRKDTPNKNKKLHKQFIIIQYSIRLEELQILINDPTLTLKSKKQTQEPDHNK